MLRVQAELMYTVESFSRESLSEGRWNLYTKYKN